MGSMGETASLAVDALRKKGVPVGLVKLRLWRPFPVEELRVAVKGAKTLIVMDRAISFGVPAVRWLRRSNPHLYHDGKRRGSSISSWASAAATYP